MAKVYLSGPITNLPAKESKKLFEEGEELIRSLGHEPLNPRALDPPNAPYGSYYFWQEGMKASIKLMMDADLIYFLDNDTYSVGTGIEKKIAKQIGIEELTIGRTTDV